MNGLPFAKVNRTLGRSDPPVKPTSEVAHQPGQQPATLFSEIPPPPPPRLSPSLFSSYRQNWRTPEAIYQQFVPPCFDVSDRHDGTFSALHDPWPEPWFCNPPYDRYLLSWTGRMTGQGVALLPARTDTRWFHDHLLGRCRIEFIRGRLRFDGATINAPFPSMLCYFGGYECGHGSAEECSAERSRAPETQPVAPAEGRAWETPATRTV